MKISVPATLATAALALAGCGGGSDGPAELTTDELDRITGVANDLASLCLKASVRSTPTDMTADEIGRSADLASELVDLLRANPDGDMSKANGRPNTVRQYVADKRNFLRTQQCDYPAQTLTEAFETLPAAK
jgi:hypothetical protein